MPLVVEFLALRLEHCGQPSDSPFKTLFHFVAWAADGLDGFRRTAGAWLATSFPNPPSSVLPGGACAAGFRRVPDPFIVVSFATRTRVLTRNYTA